MAKSELEDFLDELLEGQNLDLTQAGIAKRLGKAVMAYSEADKLKLIYKLSFLIEKTVELTEVKIHRSKLARYVETNIEKKIETSRKRKEAAHASHKKDYEHVNKIRELWAGGNFESRDICADQEWEAIGFGSRKTARNALLGTPDPAPWLAKQPRKRANT